MFDQEVLGRSMFYNKVHGSCTSSSVYLTTILRALGIPRRIVLCTPPFDPNDNAQYQMFQDNIHNYKVRDTILAGTHNKGSSSNPMFCNHLFNEVYVGHHWVRLNYKRLGQPILDAGYFGLLTHIYTTGDLSKVPLAQTWGVRYWGLIRRQYPADQPRLSSFNPYQLISVQDHFGTNAHLDNPPVPELTTVTIIGLYRPGAHEIPAWVHAVNSDSFPFMIASKEWIPGANMQMTDFWHRAGHDFLLTSPNHASIHARLLDARYSTGSGDFQAYEAEIIPEDVNKVVSGAAYSIHPNNTSEKYRWATASDLAPVILKN